MNARIYYRSQRDKENKYTLSAVECTTEQNGWCVFEHDMNGGEIHATRLVKWFEYDENAAIEFAVDLAREKAKAAEVA